MLETENSIGICLTETWLDDSVCDGEIQMKNFEIFRSDRSVRQRGGAALYLRKELYGKSIFKFSNSVVEALIVKVRKLRSLVVCIYRPPSTSNDKWSNALSSINDAIELTQANEGYETILVGGDFNFPDIKWEENLPRFDLNLRTQEENFVNFMSEHSLLNYVMSPTRKNNILDFVLTNDSDLIMNTVIEINVSFSDHNTVSCALDIDFTQSQDSKKFTEYLTSVPKFGWRNSSVEQWKQYENTLNSRVWSEISGNLSVQEKVDILLKNIENAVLTFENLMEKSPKRTKNT